MPGTGMMGSGALVAAVGGAVLLVWSVVGRRRVGRMIASGRLMPAAGVGGAGGAVRARSARRGPDTALDVASVLDEVAQGARSGATLLGALRAAASGGDGVRSPPEGSARASVLRVVRGVEGGATLVEALETERQGVTDPELSVALSTLAVVGRSGGAYARALGLGAARSRSRAELRAECRAVSAQVRSSVVLLVIAPPAFGALMGIVDPRVARVQFGSPVGWMCMAGAAGLDLLAWRWMGRLMGRAGG